MCLSYLQTPFIFNTDLYFQGQNDPEIAFPLHYSTDYIQAYKVSCRKGRVSFVSPLVKKHFQMVIWIGTEHKS